MTVTKRTLIFILLLGIFIPITAVAHAGATSPRITPWPQPDLVQFGTRAPRERSGNDAEMRNASVIPTQWPRDVRQLPKVAQDGGFIFLPMIVKSPPYGWTTIISDDFEGAWPGAWTVQSSSNASYWGTSSCRAYEGSHSAWVMGAGYFGPAPCGSNYPNAYGTYIVYGPFSLADASAAELRFRLWINTEPNYDTVCRWASLDNYHYYGSCTSGSSGDAWLDQVLDLSDVPTLGNLLGKPSVWIMIRFYANPTNSLADGAYIDNVLLRKCTSEACASEYSRGALSPSSIVEQQSSLELK